MPLVSQERIDGVMSTLLTGSYDLKMAILRKQPINPPNGATGMDIMRPMGPFLPGQTPPDPRTVQFSKLKIARVEDMVGFFKLGAVERDQIGAMTFAIKLASELRTTASRAGWVPCWFLPWMSGHIFKLKILSVLTDPVLNFDGGIDAMPNPGLFFTAGINGCSVFAIGNGASPSVYHGGINPGSGLAMPLQPNETTEAAWRRLLGRAHTTKTVGMVGKTDYISELNPGAANDNDRVRHGGYKTTARASQFETLLQANGQLTNVSVSPWGAVFGLRDATGVWHMNLVKNATVTYHRVIRTVKKRFLIPDKVTVAQQGEVRPRMTLGKTPEGLPDLATAGTVDNAEQVISNCYNLGYQEFFPGAGAAHYRDLATIQVF